MWIRHIRNTFLLVVPQVSGERGLRALPPGDLVLRAGQHLAPVGLAHRRRVVPAACDQLGVGVGTGLLNAGGGVGAEQSVAHVVGHHDGARRRGNNLKEENFTGMMLIFRLYKGSVGPSSSWYFLGMIMSRFSYTFIYIHTVRYGLITDLREPPVVLQDQPQERPMSCQRRVQCHRHRLGRRFGVTVYEILD